jgi:hypothetical protein
MVMSVFTLHYIILLTHTYVAQATKELNRSFCLEFRGHFYKRPVIKLHVRK